MAYVKNTTWVDGTGGGTRIDAADLNNIEDGIFAAAATADAAAFVHAASGYWHVSPYLARATSPAPFAAANIAWNAPFRFPVAVSVTAIAFTVCGAATGTTPVYRLGLYLGDGTNGFPNTLLDQATVAADSIGDKTWTLGTPQAIAAGALIWVAVALQGVGASGGTARVGASVPGLQPTYVSGASWIGGALSTGCRISASGAFTSSPSPTVSADDASRFPYPAVRISL